MAATTSYIIEQIKIEGALKDVIAKSNAENVSVNVGSETKTLASVLASMPTAASMGEAIAQAISESGHASFVKADVVPAVADAETNKLYLVPNSATGHLDIYAKIAGETEGSYTMELLGDSTVNLDGKLDKVTGAVANNIPAFTASGALQDSGKAIGGATLAATPDSNTLATEAAVDYAIGNQAAATSSAKGLMSSEDKTRLDGIRGVRYGATVPDDMQNGELFIRIVSTGA